MKYNIMARHAGILADEMLKKTVDADSVTEAADILQALGFQVLEQSEEYRTIIVEA